MLKTCGKVRQQEVTQEIMELQFLVEQIGASENVEEGSGDIKKVKEELITASS